MVPLIFLASVPFITSSSDPTSPSPAPRRHLMPTAQLKKFSRAPTKQSALAPQTLPAYRHASSELEAWKSHHPGWIQAPGINRGCKPGPRDAVILPVCLDVKDNSTGVVKSVRQVLWIRLAGHQPSITLSFDPLGLARWTWTATPARASAACLVRPLQSVPSTGRSPTCRIPFTGLTRTTSATRASSTPRPPYARHPGPPTPSSTPSTASSTT